jgi:hypothetical protein
VQLSEGTSQDVADLASIRATLSVLQLREMLIEVLGLPRPSARQPASVKTDMLVALARAQRENVIPALANSAAEPSARAVLAFLKTVVHDAGPIEWELFSQRVRRFLLEFKLRFPEFMVERDAFVLDQLGQAVSFAYSAVGRAQTDEDPLWTEMRALVGRCGSPAFTAAWLYRLTGGSAG